MDANKHLTSAKAGKLKSPRVGAHTVVTLCRAAETTLPLSDSIAFILPLLCIASGHSHDFLLSSDTLYRHLLHHLTFPFNGERALRLPFHFHSPTSYWGVVGVGEREGDRGWDVLFAAYALFVL